MTLDIEGPLWTFALEFYRQPGVATACLALQDEANVDVIHLILVLYAHAVLDRPFSNADIAAARTAMTDWREATVVPLRAIRRFLKPPRPDFPDEEKEILRTQVKSAELMAEQIQIALASLWLDKRPAGVRIPLEEALSSLVAHYDHGGLPEGQKVSGAIDVIVHVVLRWGANRAQS